MKRTLTALMAVIMLGITAQAKPVNVSCPTDSATCTVISKSTSKAAAVNSLVVSASTADNLTVKCGSTAIFGPVYLGATSTVSADFKGQSRNSSLICAPNNDVTVTKGTTTTPVTVWVEYDQ